MNWAIFAVVSYVLLLLQAGLAPLWTVQSLSPQLLLILAVFLAVSAPPAAAAWACLILGLLVDLVAPYRAASLLVVGPSAVGYLAGAYVAGQIRGLIFRNSPLTLVLVTLLAGLGVQLVTVAVLTLRGMLPWLAGEFIPGFRATDELWLRLLELLYTAAMALPVGFLLMRTDRWWDFYGRRGSPDMRPRRVR